MTENPHAEPVSSDGDAFPYSADAQTSIPNPMTDAPYTAPVPFPSGLDHDTVAYQLDALRKSHDDLHAKLNHAIEGIGAVYQIVDHLARMLSAVQQVASMMPGGKKIAQAMQNGVKNNG